MHANQILDPIFHQVLGQCLNTSEFFKYSNASLTKRNNATFRVIEIVPPFDAVTIAYIHKCFEKKGVQCK